MEISSSFRNMRVSPGFYDAIVLPHCKIRLCTCIMYYLDAFLHDFMSQISQMSFYCEPRGIKCNKLLQVCRHDINMSVIKNLVAIDQLVKNITVEANHFFMMCLFILYILSSAFPRCYWFRVSCIETMSLFCRLSSSD